MRYTVHRSAYTLLSFLSLSIAYQSPGRPCPELCNVAGNSPANWTDLHGLAALERCKEPVLFDTALFTPVNDPNLPLTLRSCTASGTTVVQEVEYKPAPFTFGSPTKPNSRIVRRIGGYGNVDIGARQASNSSSATVHGCMAGAETFRHNAPVDMLSWNVDDDSLEADSKAGIISAAQVLKQYLGKQADCDSTVMMARHKNAVIGLYVGTEVLTSSATEILNQFISAVQNKDDVSRFAVQTCPDKAPSSWLVGIYADFRGNISATQESMAMWAMGKCLTSAERKDAGKQAEMTLIRATGVPDHIDGKRDVDTQPEKRELVPRAECKAIQVESGDGCWSLSERCGITQEEFESFNPIDDICDPVNGVRPKQWVCCSKGDLPDMGPKPDADGNCATYTVNAQDTCYQIAESFGITVERIESVNNDTWGWGGCTAIQPGDTFCVSTGKPPMPAWRSNAICGPQVLGTERATDGTDIKDLNPCPLNVCCNVWGQCGTTDDFCIYNPADTGAPGTTQPGKNSCVSSCGMEITNNDEAPEEFRKITYFEAWNHNRPCLHMDVTDVDKDKFSMIHFAFPGITPDFKVNLTGIEDQFEKLKDMEGIKRIVSFGGWAFSTEAPTYNIFREGVTDANRATLATNIASFVNENDLDGVDFDWEYPSAPDIPGIPPSTIEAGKQYLEFLQIVKRRLSSKSVSIAAPASYWYLKGFPIEEISKVTDYIVYMTYDLHGQWDYGNKWSSSGCESGNCLRSHVNITETTNSLAMITKAGVNANKVVVGVASYGRSFHMAESGCDGPNCKFTGSASVSEAMPGKCTETSGYISNAEIREILVDGLGGIGPPVKSWHDAASNSDLLVYDDLEWIGYMSDTTKRTRTDWVKGLNFGGTSDWAADLDKDYGEDGIGSVDPSDVEMGGGPKCDQAGDYTSLEAISGDSGLDSTCAALYTLNVLSQMVDDSSAHYNAVNDGYDSKFQSYIKYMKKGLPEVLRQYVHYLNGPGVVFFDCHFVGNGNDWTGACPVPRSVRGTSLIGVWKIDMTLRDHDGFFDDLNKQTGILEDWIEYYTYKEETMCIPAPCNKLFVEVTGMPRLKDDYEIPNPKDIVEKAMANQGGLKSQLTVQVFEVGMGLWEGNNADVIQALAVPVFLIENAIDGMEKAKELGEDEEKQEAQNKLLTILSLVFLVVPFLGEAAAVAAGAAQMARVIAIIGLGANAGLALQDVIENPEMAPFAILELLTAGRLKAPRDYVDAVKFRRAMSTDDIGTLGTKFVDQDKMIQKIARVCGK